MRTVRKLLAAFLLLVSVPAIVLGTATLAVYRTVFDTGRVRSIASDLLRRPEIQEEIAERFVERAVDQERRLSQFQTPLRLAALEVVESEAFGRIFVSIVSLAHQNVVEGEGDEVVLGLGEVRALIGDRLETLAPSVSELLPPEGAFDRAIVIHVPKVGTVREAQNSSWLGGVVLLAVGILALVGGVLTSVRRWRTLGVTGVWLATVALLSLGAIILGVEAVPGALASEDSANALGAAWDVALADLRLAMVVLSVVGAVLAVAGFVFDRRTRVLG